MKCFPPFQTKPPAKVVVTPEVHGAQAEFSGAQAVEQAVGRYKLQDIHHRQQCKNVQGSLWHWH